MESTAFRLFTSNLNVKLGRIEWTEQLAVHEVEHREMPAPASGEEKSPSTSMPWRMTSKKALLQRRIFKLIVRQQCIRAAKNKQRMSASWTVLGKALPTDHGR